MPLSEDEKFNLLHSDAAWRMGVDAQLQGITTSLSDLVRIEEKQTVLMASISELKRKAEEHARVDTDLRLLMQSVETIKETVEKTAVGLEELRKDTDARLDKLEVIAERESWATKSVERVVAFAVMALAVLSHFIDFGDK